MRLILTAIISFSIVCCAEVGNGDDSSGHIVRDSAGIEIVENVSPAWDEDNAWELGEAATFDICGGEGEAPDCDLYRVRDAVVMTDGRIVVANGGTMELRFYTENGEFLAAAGREGDGPGEFRSITWLKRFPGDSLIVFDRRQLRLSVFDALGQFQRDVTIRSVGDVFVELAGVFGDGSVLSFGTPLTEAMGVFRRQDFLFRLGRDGELIDTLGVFVGEEAFVRDLNPGPVMAGNPYFHRSSMYVAGDDRLYVATNDTYEIGVYSLTGDLLSIFRRRFTPLDVTDEAVNFIRDRFVSIRSPHPMRPQLEEFSDARPVPETMPAYSAVELDEGGNLWVEEYRYPNDDVSRWTVFDRDGVMLGTIRMPEGFRLLYAGEQFVLGTWMDALDVDHVREYELIKP